MAAEDFFLLVKGNFMVNDFVSESGDENGVNLNQS